MEESSSQTTTLGNVQGSEDLVVTSNTPREEPISWTTPLSLGLYTLVPSQATRNSLSPSQVFLAQTVQVGLISGLFLGALRGGQNRGAAFLAENAHRLPKTNLGFYNFQKQRNNQMVRAAAESGARYGLRFGALLGVYGLGEYCTEVFVTKKESWLGPFVGGLLCGCSVIATCKSLYIHFCFYDPLEWLKWQKNRCSQLQTEWTGTLPNGF